MPLNSLKITYFQALGGGEPLRLVCVVAGLDFTDEILKPSQRAATVAKTPYLGLPVMEIDGRQFAQTFALMRYLGKETGLYPSNALQALMVDEAVEALGDLMNCIMRCLKADKDRQREEADKLVKVDVPRYMGGLEKRMGTFGNGPFVVGDTITIADLTLVTIVNELKAETLKYVETDVIDKFPKVLRAYEETMNNEKIVAWYKKGAINGVST